MEKSMSKAIDSFTDSFRYLSNFAYTPLRYNGKSFLSAEAAYQAAKCKNSEDQQLFSSLTASEAKKLGRKIEIREDWDEIKLGIMTDIVRIKFKVYPGFAEALRLTHPAPLIEGNYWGDTYWGVCNGEGQNHLGEILMQVRQDIIEGRL